MPEVKKNVLMPKRLSVFNDILDLHLVVDINGYLRIIKAKLAHNSN